MSNFANIDPSTLDHVTGGATPKQPASSSSSSSSSALTGQLSGIQDSIKSLASAPAQKSAFSDPTTALMFCLALQNRPAAQTNVVYVGRRGWW